MGKRAFCFPGQLQERPLVEDHHPLKNDPHLRKWMERTFSQIGFNLLNFTLLGEEKEGEDILKLQISTYLLSMVHFFQLRAEGWTPHILAEHSMGIYAALAASEAITFEEGLYITESIGRVLEREGTIHRGAMASIIGLTFEDIQRIFHDLNGYHLSIANYNGSMHHVLTGEEEGVEKAISMALSRKAISATRLAFHTALHSPSLLSLKDEILNLLKEINVQTPKIPILNHWTVRPLRREEIKDFLSQEIGHPVYWFQCVEKMIQEGIHSFIEVGHEATLTKLIRWINRDVEAFSAGDRR
jgi:malonyl CoA-acyl carrier protein transacylase